MGIGLLALTCLAPWNQLHAQVLDIGRLEDEIARNAELIEQAKQLVSLTNSAKARASLQTAIHLHQESINLLTNLNRPLLSAQQIKRAREAILRAISLAKQEAKTEESARKAIERAVKRLDLAAALLQETTDNRDHPARKIIEGARVQLQRADDNLQEHLFATALQLALSSESLSNQAIKLLKKDNLDAASVERELNKTGRLLERITAYEKLSEHPLVEKMYREAQDVQAQAQENLKHGRPRPALELTRRARVIAMNAIKILTASPEQANVDQALQLTENLIESAEDMILDFPSENIEKKISRARQLQDKAKSLYHEGEYDKSLRHTLQARELTRDAVGSMNKPLNADEVGAALRRTDELIEQVKAEVVRSDRPENADILERIISHQDTAWQEYQRGRLKAALTRTKLARNLVLRILG